MVLLQQGIMKILHQRGPWYLSVSSLLGEGNKKKKMQQKLTQQYDLDERQSSKRGQTRSG